MGANLRGTSGGILRFEIAALHGRAEYLIKMERSMQLERPGCKAGQGIRNVSGGE